MFRDSERPNREPVITKRADIENNGWRLLADAIIVQSANDYRKLLRKMAKRPHDLELKHDKTDIERFFSSDRFNILCDLDGRELMRRLQKPTRRMEGIQ